MTLRLGDIELGHTRTERLVDNLTRGHIIGYAIAVGDAAAEHSDEVYCTQVAGLPSVFAHGMFTAGLTTRMLTNWAGAGGLKAFSLRFAATRVWPGDTVTAVATVVAIDPDRKVADIDYVTSNQHGKTLISGKATLQIAA